MLLAFTAIVLVGAVVPLTLNATSHDRNSFIAAAAGTARTDAVLAQAELGLDAAAAQRQPPPKHYQPSASVAAEAEFSLLTIVKEARQAGDSLLVLTSGGKREINVAMPPGNWDQLVSQASQQAESALLASQPVQPASEIAGSYVIVALPVAGQGALANTVTGTVILARSTKPLDNEIVALWVILGSVAAAGLIAAALVAFGLARWVSRPLKGLDAAARTLADGDLAIRAKVESGPPELRRLGTTFNTMAGRLEALVHGNRAVIADVSHQLRTPLAALRLRLDLLAADTSQSDPETAHELAGALDELARLSRLVDGLLTVARAENVVPVPTAVDVAEVARERVVAWHPVADDRSIVLIATSAGAGGGLGGALGRGAFGGRAGAGLDRRGAPGADPGQPDRQRPGRAEPGPPGAAHHVGHRGRGADHGRRQRPGHERRGPRTGLPALHHLQPERHRAGPGHRAPAGHLERRHGPAGRDTRRRPDRHP